LIQSENERDLARGKQVQNAISLLEKEGEGEGSGERRIWHCGEWVTVFADGVEVKVACKKKDGGCLLLSLRTRLGASKRK